LLRPEKRPYGVKVHFHVLTAFSFDAISRKPLELHLKLVRAMTKRHAGSLLLSHDNGWYEVGQVNGGEVRDFNYITDVFLPAFRKSGGSEATIRKLTVEKPAAVLPFDLPLAEKHENWILKSPTGGPT
jgi:predicted metal-dependent phosphotriesterase family hydrolase